MNNFVYYKEIGNYVVLFIPSGDSNVTEDYFNPNLANPFYREFPNNFIKKDSIIVEAGFDNDLPIGLCLSTEMKIKVNLRALNGISELNGLMTSKPANLSTRTVYGRNVSIPNAWLIIEKDTNKIEFYGYQEIRPENKFTLGAVNEYEISCISFESGLFKRITVNDLDNATFNGTITYVDKVVNLDIEDDIIDPNGVIPSTEPINIKIKYGYGEEYDNIYKDQDFGITTLNSLTNHIFLTANDMIEALSRRSIFINQGLAVNLYQNIDIYTRLDNKTEQYPATSSLANFAAVIYEVRYNGSKIASFWQNAKQSIGLDNAYDILRYMSEDSILKGSIDYEGGNQDLGVIFRYIFDDKYIIGSDYYISDKIITIDDFINQVTITDSFNTIGSIQTSNELLNANDNEQNLVWKNNLSIKDNSYDIKNVLNIRSKLGTIQKTTYNYAQRNPRMHLTMSDIEPDLRGLYKSDGTNYINVYDDANIHLGGSIVINKFDETLFTTFLKTHSYFLLSTSDTMLNRLVDLSYNARQIEAIKYMLGDGEQVLLQTDTKADRFKPSSIGEVYMISLSDITDNYINAGYKAILVSSSWELEKDICKIKLFIR